MKTSLPAPPVNVSLPVPLTIVLASALPVILTALVREEASAVVRHDSSVTLELVELFINNAPPTIFCSLPAAFINVSSLSLPFLTVKVFLPIVKTASELLSEVAVIAAPIDILSPVA